MSSIATDEELELAWAERGKRVAGQIRTARLVSLAVLLPYLLIIYLRFAAYSLSVEDIYLVLGLAGIWFPREYFTGSFGGSRPAMGQARVDMPTLAPQDQLRIGRVLAWVLLASYMVMKYLRLAQ